MEPFKDQVTTKYLFHLQGSDQNEITGNMLFQVFFVSLCPSLSPVQYKVSCPKDGCISDLSAALNLLVQIPEHNQLVIADLYNHRYTQHPAE